MNLPSFGSGQKWPGWNLAGLIGTNVVFGKGVGSSTLCHVFHFLEPIVGSVTACDGEAKGRWHFLAQSNSGIRLLLPDAELGLGQRVRSLI